MLDDKTKSEKLPQGRRYLRDAQWGFDTLIGGELSGTAFVFHLLGILAILRSVPIVILKSDRHLTPEHETVISEWKAITGNWRAIPELAFLKRVRDLAIKEGALPAWAIGTEHGIGEGSNRTVRKTEYELVYYDDKKQRHDDLAARLRAAIDWCEREMAAIERQLPTP